MSPHSQNVWVVPRSFFFKGTKVSMYFCNTRSSMFWRCSIISPYKTPSSLDTRRVILDSDPARSKISPRSICLCSGEVVQLEWSRGNMAVSTQLGLLLWKNFTYRRRQTVSLNAEESDIWISEDIFTNKI